MPTTKIYENCCALVWLVNLQLINKGANDQVHVHAVGIHGINSLNQPWFQLTDAMLKVSLEVSELTSYSSVQSLAPNAIYNIIFLQFKEITEKK